MLTVPKEQAATAPGRAEAHRAEAWPGTIRVSRDLLLTQQATILVARVAVRRMLRSGSEVLADWLMPVDGALRAVYEALGTALGGDLDATDLGPYI